ncbi:MAG: metallophosphoesterase [Anaerolineae bacterium]|nr:metallophosphoesterase [Anaerolineae bacterium]
MPDRFVDLTQGVAMVVTDLHGDGDAFDRYVAQFRQLYASGEAQRLIFLGDLIHSYGAARHDRSLEILHQVMALRAELGPDTVIMLLGNHEMPHIYGVSLAKGEIEFTPRFERALGADRATVLAFLDGLPFYVRTAAGVMLSHAGPVSEVIPHVEMLRAFEHSALLAQADAALAQAADLAPYYEHYEQVHGAPYLDDARHYLAVSGPSDPRYSHLLRAFLIAEQSRPFAVLWEALFTQNELGLTEYGYVQIAQQFLEAFSAGAPAPQRVIVSGHIVTPLGGYMLVNRYHLRLSSAAHARPREAGHYLLLDCAQPVRAANELLPALGTVFADLREAFA